MSGFQPVALFGLEVPPGEMLIPAASRFPASVSLAPGTPAAAIRCDRIAQLLTDPLLDPHYHGRHQPSGRSRG